jgi:hypothetical protein
METNGVMSAIRVLDRYTFILGPDNQPLSPKQPVFFLINFKSGEALGNLAVKLEREDPSALRTTLLETQLFFEGQDRGAQLVVSADFEPVEPGLYWYDVFVSERLVTRMPLRAIFQPQPTVGSGA